MRDLLHPSRRRVHRVWTATAQGDQRGVTLVESLILLALTSVVVGMSITYSSGLLARESLRSAAYSVYAQLKDARMEAMSRNRSCRFLVDTDSRTVQVIDLHDPGNGGDDEILTSLTLPSGIDFAQPNANPAVTLNPIGSNVYEAVFSSTGVVTAGSGDVVLKMQEQYRRVSLFVAGGLRISKWSGSTWEDGA